MSFLYVAINKAKHWFWFFFYRNETTHQKLITTRRGDFNMQQCTAQKPGRARRDVVWGVWRVENIINFQGERVGKDIRSSTMNNIFLSSEKCIKKLFHIAYSRNYKKKTENCRNGSRALGLGRGLTKRRMYSCHIISSGLKLILSTDGKQLKVVLRQSQTQRKNFRF
jgi:hypothetical protein